MKQQLKKSPWVATRGDDMGRWTIISECRVPEYFTVKATHRRNDDGPGIIKTALPAGKRQHVGPGVVKAVLHVLAAWDKSRESKFFAGNEAIAHSTQLGIGSINNAIAVLKEAGILMKTFQGMFSPRLSVLNWEEIERRREKYKPRPRTSEKPVLSSAEDDDAQSDVGEDAAFADPSDEDQVEDQLPDATLVSLVAERIQGFNLPPILKPIGKVISAVKKKFGFEVVQHAIANLEKTQLARVVSAKSPPGYLWKVLTTAIQNQGGEGGTEEGSALTEKEEELLDEAADWFNYKYTGGYEEDPSFKLNRGLYKSLIPIFRKVDRLDLEHLAAYITDAFDPAIGDKYYRTVPVEESARTFIKQLQRWKDRQ